MHLLKKCNCLKTTKAEKNNNNMRKVANSMQKVMLVKIMWQVLCNLVG